jgi:hypothetical protein
MVYNARNKRHHLSELMIQNMFRLNDPTENSLLKTRVWQKDLELYLMFRLGRIKCSKWLNLSSDNAAL